MSAAKSKLGRNPFEAPKSKPKTKGKAKRATTKKAAPKSRVRRVKSSAKDALENIDVLELLSVLTQKGPKAFAKKVRSCSYTRAKKFVKSVLK